MNFYNTCPKTITNRAIAKIQYDRKNKLHKHIFYRVYRLVIQIRKRIYFDGKTQPKRRVSFVHKK
ncbi:hypothetical protein CKA38_14065 [Ereboglobus luteus]|uniref:Uncharacterized protein n=1 Tax=Ereboglobus luteus TaxID=1796921 RepID=A0A2U8E6N0_9BACT|nr:hypothetical protein CKA38_14065 [Ereboglobus luteus]